MKDGHSSRSTAASARAPQMAFTSGASNAASTSRHGFPKKIGFLFLVFLFTYLCVGTYMLVYMYVTMAHSCMCLQRP